MNYLIIILSLLCSAFFSGMEIAFISSNKLHIELKSKQGNFTAKLLSNFSNHPTRFLGALLIGNNISLVVYGIMMAKVLASFITDFLHINNEVSILILQTLLSTILILVVAEFLPKKVFRINPNKTLSFFAIPSFLVYYIFYLPVLLIIGFSEFLLGKLFGLKFENNQNIFGRVDLDHYVKDFVARGKDRNQLEHEMQIFHNALDFKNVKIKDCMIPRTEIEAIEVNESIDSLRKQFIETGYSKILVYNEGIDNIIGFTHHSELFKNPQNIRSILHPIPYVSETMLAKDLLTKFTLQRKSIAVVVDEFGGTSGIVTIEDVMEEIFGEIDDEHDDEELLEKMIEEKKYIFSAKHKIDYLNDKYKLKIIESEDYETLAGYIVTEHKNIPKPKEILFIGNFKIDVLKVANNRVDLVKMEVLS